MPRIRTSSSTPETRRREFLLSKSSSIHAKVQSALDDAKQVVRTSLENEENSDPIPEQHLSSSSSIYHVRLVSDEEDDEEIGKSPHFITCMNIEPKMTLRSRRRTSSLPSSTIVVNLSKPLEESKPQSSSLIDFTTSWQNNPQQKIYLFDRQYHFQPMVPFDDRRFLLSNAKQIDIYHIDTGLCNEQICFQSPTMNYIGLCYNLYRDELLVASNTDLYVYQVEQRTIRYQIRLPGYPFHLDHNRHIRYLSCNSSSIYHGYFSFNSSCTSTILSRLSQYELKHISDLEFDDGTLHGLHALEHYVGIVIRYGRYSSKNREDYSLYIYDASLDDQYFYLDLKEIGYISSLTGYERTLDWILCDSKGHRLIFVNEESIEYVQYDEEIHQCMIWEKSNLFAVWLENRIYLYPMD